MANTVNISVDQGADFSFTINAKESNGSNTNLTTYDLSAKFTKNFGTAQTHNMTITASQPTAGELTVTLPGTTSANVKSGRYVYEVFISSDQLSTKRRLREGILTINPSI